MGNLFDCWVLKMNSRSKEYMFDNIQIEYNNSILDKGTNLMNEKVV